MKQPQSGAKKAAFALLAMCLPLIGILLLEGALRVVGVGSGLRTPFREVPGHPEHLQPSTAFFERYFQSFEPYVAADPFLEAKEPGSFRVFVLGGSTTVGFPYHFYHGFPARLARRLEGYAAGQPIELVNLAVTATNSYTIWELKDHVIAQQPDAVVIYSGHNEFYGAYGAASSLGTWANGVGMKRLVLSLKRSALYCSVESLLPDFRPRSVDNRSMMERLMANADIPHGGPLFESAVEQYRQNLGDSLRSFQAAGVPVYVGTLASNLRSLKPFSESPGAMEAFRAGQKQLAAGRVSDARQSFLHAKELDGVRYRAPEAINEVLRELAGAGLAELVDTQAAAARASESGIEDQSFFDDHLHPNHRGFEVFAATFFAALKEHRGLQDSGLTSYARGGLELDDFEMAYAHVQALSVVTRYPFVKGEQEKMTAERMLRSVERLRASHSYLERLAYLTLAEGKPAQEAIAEGLADSLTRSPVERQNALLLYRSLLSWRGLDRDLVDRAARFAAASEGMGEVSDEVLLQAINLSRDPAHAKLLAQDMRRRGETEAAARVDALAAGLRRD